MLQGMVLPQCGINLKKSERNNHHSRAAGLPGPLGDHSKVETGAAWTIPNAVNLRFLKHSPPTGTRCFWLHSFYRHVDPDKSGPEQ